MRLLLVEDDRMIGDSLRQALRDEGYAVDWVYDARAANATLASERFDLVLLDLGPAQRRSNGAAGSTCCARCASARTRTPVIVLTARDALGDRVAGLDAGADDYLVKPFELDELNARMRAVLRRHAGRGEPVLEHGGAAPRPGDAPGHAGRRSRWRCRRASSRCSRRCSHGPARSCRAPSSKTGSTAGARRSRATRSRSTSTSCAASSAPT